MIVGQRVRRVEFNGKTVTFPMAPAELLCEVFGCLPKRVRLRPIRMCHFTPALIVQ